MKITQFMAKSHWKTHRINCKAHVCRWPPSAHPRRAPPVGPSWHKPPPIPRGPQWSPVPGAGAPKSWKNPFDKLRYELWSLVDCKKRCTAQTNGCKISMVSFFPLKSIHSVQPLKPGTREGMMAPLNQLLDHKASQGCLCSKRCNWMSPSIDLFWLMYAIFPIDSISRLLLRFLPCSTSFSPILSDLSSWCAPSFSPILSDLSSWYAPHLFCSFPLLSRMFLDFILPFPSRFFSSMFTSGCSPCYYVIYPPFIFPGTVYLPY